MPRSARDQAIVDVRDNDVEAAIRIPKPVMDQVIDDMESLLTVLPRWAGLTEIEQAAMMLLAYQRFGRRVGNRANAATLPE